MTEQGLVVKLNKNFAQVRIGRNSACASCGKCGMTENQKHVDFYTENTLDAKVGDVVELEIHEGNTTKLAFFGYILPLIPALILLFVSLNFWNELVAMGLFFVGYAIGFAIVALIDKMRHHKWMQSPTMLRIVHSKTQENNTFKSEGTIYE